MKLLVTGGLGFIGSNFILNTFKKYPEFEITNIDAEFFGSNPKNLDSLKNKNVIFEYINKYVKSANKSEITSNVPLELQRII